MKKSRLEDAYHWLHGATTEAIRKSLSIGELTSEELVRLYFQRIQKDNTSGKSLRAVLTLNPEALALAKARDFERSAGLVRSPLHGVPILIKDNISTADRMPTSAGALALQHNRAKTNAYIVDQLATAGMVIIGKTNMTEWANFMARPMKNGYSARGGQTLHPLSPGHWDVGGSSSGSAAAVASGFAPIAIGTETSGSIINPACQNGVVGIKPTVGMISRAGIIPLSFSQDTPGVFGTTVKDAALTLAALAGHDANDVATLSSPWPEPGAFVWRDLGLSGIKGKRIGILSPDHFTFATKDEREVLQQTIHQLKALGAEVVEDVRVTSSPLSDSLTVLLHEFKVGIDSYLQMYGSDPSIRSLSDIIAFNERNAGAMLYGQDLLTESDATSGTLTEAAYLNAIQHDHVMSREKGLDEAFKRYQIDLIVSPHDHFYAIPAKAGYPSVTVPAGKSEKGHPIGITFTGSAYSEPTLLTVAHAYEQATLL